MTGVQTCALPIWDAKTLVEKNGKEAWFSEASSPMAYSQGTFRYDKIHSGLGGINGTLDIANRIITMYSGGDMTLYEYQPVVASYYDGVSYSQKQLITANEPWSGYYLLDSGYFMSLHFSQFIKKGWTFVNSACYADGKAGGDGHAIVDASKSYLTACNTKTGDFSTVITNTTDKPLTYSFAVSNLSNANKAYVWETRGPDGDTYDENYFRKVQTVKAKKDSSGNYTFSVTIKPYSLVTVTTVKADEKDYHTAANVESKILALPYSDSFSYKSYDQNYLASRGNAPRYTDRKSVV